MIVIDGDGGGGGGTPAPTPGESPEPSEPPADHECQSDSQCGPGLCCEAGSCVPCPTPATSPTPTPQTSPTASPTSSPSPTQSLPFCECNLDSYCHNIYGQDYCCDGCSCYYCGLPQQSPSPSPLSSPSPSPPLSPSPSPSQSPSSSPLPSLSPSPSPDISPSPSPSPSPSASPSPTTTQTIASCDCFDNSDCHAGYQCVNCHCEPCGTELRCRNNSVWLYSFCDSYISEQENCSRYDSDGPCNKWKCESIGSMPTYKKSYKQVERGNCVKPVAGDAYCAKNTHEEQCSDSFYCQYGCIEQGSEPNCIPHAVITSVPGADPSSNTITAFENTSVELSCQQSSDPDGTINQCKWFFAQPSGNTSSIGFSTTIVVQLGTTSVTLEACDNKGACGTAKILINGVKKTGGDGGGGSAPISENKPPIACFSVKPDDMQGIPDITEFSFDASCSSDPDAGDFITAYAWDLGDGTKAHDKIVKHVYANPGADYKIYTVTLIVTDNGKDGTKQKLSGIKTASVLVSRRLSMLSIVATPSHGIVPLSVVFVVLGAGRNIFSKYEWDFGDGFKYTGNYEALHTYSMPGEYNVKVIASNNIGASATGSVQVRAYAQKGIESLSASDARLYETTSIKTRCSGTDEISLQISTEEAQIMLSKVPCNTTLRYGPLLQPGIYGLFAEIADANCSDVECKKSTTFHVSEEIPELKTPETNQLLVALVALIAIAVVRRKNQS